MPYYVQNYLSVILASFKHWDGASESRVFCLDLSGLPSVNSAPRGPRCRLSTSSVMTALNMHCMPGLGNHFISDWKPNSVKLFRWFQTEWWSGVGFRAGSVCGSSFFVMCLMFIFAWEVQGQKEDRDICWFHLSCLQQLRLGQPDTRSQELHLGLPCEWQKCKYILLLP